MDFCKVEFPSQGTNKDRRSHIAGVQCPNCPYHAWHSCPSSSHCPTRSLVLVRIAHPRHIVAPSASCRCQGNERQDPRCPTTRLGGCWDCFAQTYLRDRENQAGRDTAVGTEPGGPLQEHYMAVQVHRHCRCAMKEMITCHHSLDWIESTSCSTFCSPADLLSN